MITKSTFESFTFQKSRISEFQNPNFSYENKFCLNSNEFELGNYFRIKDLVFILVLEKGLRACFHGGGEPTCP